MISREEVLKIAKESGLIKGAFVKGTLVRQVESFAAATYEAGAKSERAVSDRLLDALKILMRWQVKNVHKWENSAYDYADRAIAEVTAVRQERKEKPE